MRLPCSTPPRHSHRHDHRRIAHQTDERLAPSALHRPPACPARRVSRCTAARHAGAAVDLHEAEAGAAVSDHPSRGGSESRTWRRPKLVRRSSSRGRPGASRQTPSPLPSTSEHPISAPVRSTTASASASAPYTLWWITGVSMPFSCPHPRPSAPPRAGASKASHSTRVSAAGAGRRP